MKKTTLAIAIASAALMVAAPVHAHKKGEFIVRVGTATVDPDESSSLIDAGVLGPVPDTGLAIDSDTQLGLTFAYMITDRVAVELLAASPFKHDVTMNGNGLAGVVDHGTKIADVKHLPPTLSLQYFFLDPSSKFQPYAGIGINYTLILDEELSSGVESVLGASNLDVDDSVGVTFQVGMDYEINDKWLINASVWNMDIETEASFDSAVGKVKADLDIDPWVYMVGIGYKF